MTSITVRNLDDAVKSGLRVRAARNGRSMEQEVRDILQRAVADDTRPQTQSLAERINRRFKGLHAEDITVPARQSARTAPDLAAQ